MSLTQKDQFLKKYRQLAFLVAVSVQHNQHGGLLARVREVNKYNSTEDTDLFKYTVVKEHAGALTATDMQQFVDWMVNATPAALESKGKFKAKFLELKAMRLAWYHVMHPEGTVPQHRSMLPFNPDRTNFSFCLRNGRIHQQDYSDSVIGSPEVWRRWRWSVG